MVTRAVYHKRSFPLLIDKLIAQNEHLNNTHLRLSDKEEFNRVLN